MEHPGNLDSSSNSGERHEGDYNILTNTDNEHVDGSINADADPENELTDEEGTPAPAHDDATDNMDLDTLMLHESGETKITTTIEDNSDKDNNIESSPLPDPMRDKDKQDADIAMLSDSKESEKTTTNDETANK